MLGEQSPSYIHMAKTKIEKQARNLEILMYVLLVGGVGFVIGGLIWLGVVFVVLAIITMIFVYKVTERIDKLEENGKMEESK